MTGQNDLNKREEAGGAKPTGAKPSGAKTEPNPSGADTGGNDGSRGVPDMARARRAIADLSARSRKLLERARVAERMRSMTTNWLIVAAVVAVAAQVLAVGAVVSSYRQKSEIEALVSSRDELREEIAGLETMREEMTRLEGELVMARAARAETIESRVEAERRVERLAATEEAAGERLAGLRDRAAEAEAAVKLLESRQAAAADKLAALEGEAAKRQSEAAAALATLEPLTEQTAGTEKRLSEARAAWSTAIDDLQTVRTTLGERKAELAAIEMQAQLAKDAAAVHEARVDALVKREAELAAAMEMDRAAAERLVTQREMAEAELSEVKGEVESAAAELANKRGRLSAVLEMIDRAEREAAELEAGSGVGRGVESSAGSSVVSEVSEALAAVEPSGAELNEGGAGGVARDEGPADESAIIEGQDR